MVLQRLPVGRDHNHRGHFDDLIDTQEEEMRYSLAVAGFGFILGIGLAGPAYAHGTHVAPAPAPAPKTGRHQGPFSVLHLQGPFSVLGQVRR